MMKNRKKIIKMLLEGKPIKTISKKFDIPEDFFVKKCLLVFNNQKTRGILGFKKAKDFHSEEEMLNMLEYTYDNLSNSEKNIYNERKKNGTLGKYFNNA